jgi:F-type H+-transporting ATPase subunit epsilon
MALHVELVSPEDIVFNGEANMVIARTPAGEIAFQPGHVPFVGVLSGKSPVRIYLTDNTVMFVAVHSGFVEVSNDRVTILSDVAELAAAIDVGRAQAARERAETRLREKSDDEAAADALARATLRLSVAGATSTSHAGH